jgi:hypothetical protein
VVANLQNAECCLSGCSMAFTVQLENDSGPRRPERALEAVERRGLCANSASPKRYSCGSIPTPAFKGAGGSSVFLVFGLVNTAPLAAAWFLELRLVEPL